MTAQPSERPQQSEQASKAGCRRHFSAALTVRGATPARCASFLLRDVLAQPGALEPVPDFDQDLVFG